MLSKFIYYKIFGWKITGFSDFKSVKKAVIIAAPHTSWHDFYIGVLLRSVIDVKANFIAKKSLFNPFTGWMFRALGGAPVIRKRNEKQVDAIARLFDKYEEFRMVIAPEGTRKKVEQWKTGFYYIAKQANVPVVMLRLILKIRKIVFQSLFFLPTT